MYQFPEKRNHDRHDRLGTLLVSDQDQSSIKVILLNYSEQGLYIKAPCPLVPGQTLYIKSAGPLKGKVPETCYGKVIWCSPVAGKHPHFRAGIKYTQPEQTA